MPLLEATFSIPFSKTPVGGGGVRDFPSRSRLSHQLLFSSDGMFAILVPAALGPLIITLLWAERKAKRLGLLDVLYAHASPSESLKDRIVRVTKQLDVIGLCLIGASISLILIPITLARKTTGDIAEKWKEPGSIVMLVLGFVLIPLFVFYEWKYAKHPVVPKRFVTNRSFVIATTIGFFDFVRDNDL